jgi:hypothetical protein
MKLAAGWQLSVAVAVGAVLAVGGSKLMDRSSPSVVTGDFVRPPSSAVLVPMATARPTRRIARGRASRIPPMLARPTYGDRAQSAREDIFFTKSATPAATRTAATYP